MAAKLPWFPWFANDWLADEKLRACSIAARGLWADMLSLMHKNDRRGYLQVGGKPVTAEQLARMTGCSTDEVSRLLAELVYAGVPSVLADGTHYSRRMVRQEKRRQDGSAAGKKGGGNPSLKSATYKGEVKGEVKGAPKGLSDCDVCKEESVISRLEQTTHTSGVGGAGGGETYKSPTKGPAKGRAVDALDGDFDRFWALYPRKVAKMDARIAWDKLGPDAALVEIILLAIGRQSQSEQWKRGVVPNPMAWLAGCRWHDELGARGVKTESIEARIERERHEQCRDPGTTGPSIMPCSSRS